ncbi:MAG: hypothetical protein RL634_608 [Bacteroidota bacterium]|jgi:Putative auto-transporter adhesin, head GIN domain
MMKSLVFSMVLFSGMFLNAQEKVIINDPLAVVRDMGSFDGIEISGPFKVYYSVGANYSVAISANSESVRDRIRVKKSGGILMIDLENTYKNWFSNETRLKVYISSPSIKHISASGAVDFFVTDLLKSDDLKIQFTGASDFLGKLECKRLQVHFSGASDIELTGKVNDLDAVLTGACKLNASTMKVENAEVKVSGASKSTINVHNNLHATATGASHIYYYGNPQHIEVSSSGASKIKRAD